MPINEFERQVQKKMEELQLRPSALVWQEVERRIRKDKKRRRIIFWLLFPLLISGTALVYFNTGKGKNAIAFNIEKKQDEISVREEVNQPAPIKINDDNSKEIKGSFPVRAYTNPGQKRSYGIKNENKDFIINANETLASNEVLITDAQTNKEEIGEVITNVQEVELKEINVFTASKDKVQVGDDSTENIKQKASGSFEEKDSGLIKKIVLEKNVNDEIKTGPEKEAIVSVDRKKWVFGFEVRGGVAGARKGPILEKEKSMYAPSPNTSVGATFTPVAPPVLLQVSEPGLSAGISIFGEKPVGKRWNIRTGIEYDYSSTITRVAGRIDNARIITNNVGSSVLVESYYLAPIGQATKDYVNHFHQLGISGYAAWKAISRKKFSLSWENGVTLGRLISSDALLFDGTLRGYYTDFSAFNKTQFSISTALVIPVGSTRSFSLQFRPFASYGLNSLQKGDNFQNAHLIHYGAGLKFLFKGNK